MTVALVRDVEDTQVAIELVERNGLAWLVEFCADACEVGADMDHVDIFGAADLLALKRTLNQIARKLEAMQGKARVG